MSALSSLFPHKVKTKIKGVIANAQTSVNQFTKAETQKIQDALDRFEVLFQNRFASLEKKLSKFDISVREVFSKNEVWGGIYSRVEKNGEDNLELLDRVRKIEGALYRVLEKLEAEEMDCSLCGSVFKYYSLGPAGEAMCPHCGADIFEEFEGHILRNVQQIYSREEKILVFFPTRSVVSTLKTCESLDVLPVDTRKNLAAKKLLDICSSGFEESLFETIYLRNFFDNVDDHSTALLEMLRILRDDGEIIVSLDSRTESYFARGEDGEISLAKIVGFLEGFGLNVESNLMSSWKKRQGLTGTMRNSCVLVCQKDRRN